MEGHGTDVNGESTGSRANRHGKQLAAVGHSGEDAEDHEGADGGKRGLPVVEEHREGVRTLVTETVVGAVDFLLGLGDDTGSGEGGGMRDVEADGEYRERDRRDGEGLGYAFLVQRHRKEERKYGGPEPTKKAPPECAGTGGSR